MLVLTRKIGQAIHVGEDIEISVQDIRGSQVRLGIEAPREVRVYRDEIFQEILTESKKALEQTLVNALPESPQESLMRFRSRVQDSSININSGLIGFSDWKKFELSTAKEPFFWIKSKEKKELQFLALPVTEFKDKLYKGFEIEESKEIFCLISPEDNFLESTVNIKAPIVIDPSDKAGDQIIFDDDKIEVKLTLAELLSIVLT